MGNKYHKMMTIIAEELGVAFNDAFVGKSQSETPMDARCIFYKLTEQELSKTAAGRLTNRHRSTVWAAIITANERIRYNRPFREKFERCIRRIAEMEGTE